MQGTFCISGSGIGVVVATGDRTVFGRIAKMTNTPKGGMTTLEKEVLNFVIIICSIMFAMIAIVLIVWGTYLRVQYPTWINVPTLIVSCVSVAIAFIPEGLPIALTASLTITANLMRKNKILCKSLKTVETLGAVSVICSDKTGTLTKASPYFSSFTISILDHLPPRYVRTIENGLGLDGDTIVFIVFGHYHFSVTREANSDYLQNKMFVTECSIGSCTMTPETARDEMIQRRKDNPDMNAVEQLRALAGLCNAGEFDAVSSQLPLHERKIHGDATDQAILRFSESLGPVTDLRQLWRKSFELAFNSKNKFMIRTLSLMDRTGLGFLSSKEAADFSYDDMLLTIKGAPDVLISRCSTYVSMDGQTKALDKTTRAAVENIKNQWSSQGKRVILLARKIVKWEVLQCSPASSRFEEEISQHARSALTLVGIVGIVDPPRDEIPEVVMVLRNAGIRIFMVGL